MAAFIEASFPELGKCFGSTCPPSDVSVPAYYGCRGIDLY